MSVFKGTVFKLTVYKTNVIDIIFNYINYRRRRR